MSGSPQRRRCGGGLFRIARIIHDGIVADCAALAAASKLPGGTPTDAAIWALASAGAIGNPLGGYCVLTQPSASLTLSVALKGYGLVSVNWGDGTAIQRIALDPTNTTTVSRTWGSGANMTVMVAGNITDFNATNGSEGGLLRGLKTLTGSMYCNGASLTFSDVLTAACWPNLTNTVYFNGSSMTLGGTLTASFWPNLSYQVIFYGNSMTLSGTLTAACWPNLTYTVLFYGNSMTLSGTLTASFWPNLSYQVYVSGNYMTLGGTLTAACWPNLTYQVYFSGSLMTLGGTLTASFWPNLSYQVLFYGNSMTLSGTLTAACWPNLTYQVYFFGSSMTIGGQVTFAKAVNIDIEVSGPLTYNTSSGQFTFPSNMQQYKIRPAASSWTQAMTDASCIDLAAAGGTWATPKLVDERGNCAAPSAASLTARTVTLPGKSVTVNTN